MAQDTNGQISSTSLKEMSFFKDQKGQWAIWQAPNIPLYGWLASKLLSFIIKQPHIHAGFERLSMAFLFTWAFLEITQGVNYFRRILGAVVIIGIIVGYFSQ